MLSLIYLNARLDCDFAAKVLNFLDIGQELRTFNMKILSFVAFSYHYGTNTVRGGL